MDPDLDSLLAELSCGEDERAESAALALAAYGDKVLPGISVMLDSSNVDDRWWAVRTMAQMKKPPLGRLLQSLADEDETVRQCALLALSLHPTKKAIPTLVRFLFESEPITVNLAASALISIGSPAVPALLDLPVDVPHLARLEIIRALAMIADPSAIPALMAALESDSPAMQYWAELGLERLNVGMLYFKSE